MINKIFPSVSRIESGWLSAPATKRKKNTNWSLRNCLTRLLFVSRFRRCGMDTTGRRHRRLATETTCVMTHFSQLTVSSPKQLSFLFFLNLLSSENSFPPFASLLYIILLHRRYITKKGNSFLLSLSFKSGVNLINKSLPSVSIHRQLLFQTLFPFITDPLFNLSHLTFVIDVCYTHENKLNI